MAIETPLFGDAAHDKQITDMLGNWLHPQRGNPQSPILVICDAPQIDAARQSLPMEMNLLKMFAQMALPHGLTRDDFYFVGLCPPIPKSCGGSKKKEWEFIKPYADRLMEMVKQMNPHIIVTMGNNPLRAVAGKAMAVTKARGRFHDFSDKEVHPPVFPMLSPKLVSIQPDNRPIMEADVAMLGRVKKGFWDINTLHQDIETDYQWVTDLDELIENRPKIISVDVETTGLNPLADDFQVITVQISVKPGQTYICRVTEDYFPNHPWFVNVTREQIQRLRAQIKELMEDATIPKVMQGGKYDFKAMRSMGIEVCGWEWDTELMARFVNENFMTYNLDDLIKIYVPEMSGYADIFNETIDKSDMMNVPPEDMTDYAGGDSDATLRLAMALKPMLISDGENLKVMRRVHHRGLVAFTKTVETYGFGLDMLARQEFEMELTDWIANETRDLVRMVPAAVRRKYLGDDKGFKFSRAECLIDTLFGYWDENDQFHKGDGFGLKPTVFTKGSEGEHKLCRKTPSTSTKDHLPYFLNVGGKAQEFVERYTELAKATKMLTGFVQSIPQFVHKGYQEQGSNEQPDVLLPQYNFKTNTKRSQSTSPNGQNFPKRGKFVKPFRRLIKANHGKLLVASDLSQAELRIAAWMAGEREMLKIYRDDGDIHTITAAMAMGIADEAFAELDAKERKLRRFQAKAVNFGFIYGAFPRTFQVYAKTNYGVDYTLKEAELIRERYFEKYVDLIPWHERTKAFAHEYGYVKSLHGLTRHLPSIWSEDWGIQTGAERNAVNSPVQNFGSDLGIIALTRIAAQADPAFMRPVGFIHDQLICEVDENHYIEGMGVLQWCMENPPLQEWFGITPPVPIKSDPEWGPNMAESVELGDADQAIQDAVAQHNRMPEWWDVDEEAAWDRYVANNDCPEYTWRDTTGEMQRQHVVLQE